MSRITRSTAHLFQSSDENAAPAGTRFTRNKSSTMGLSSKLGSSKMGGLKVPKGHNRSRAVLGDISNRNIISNQQNEDRMAKKKQRAIVESLPAANKKATSVLPPVEHIKKETKALKKETATMNLRDVLEDVDMKEENSLEAGVADLNLDQVDAADVDNPQMVAEYVNDIMIYLKKIEGLRHPSATYMAKQVDINARMREILIDWLIEVHFKFKLCTETLFLTINIIDRFLERRAVSRTKLQLVGCTAMLIASKYEEIYAPEVRDFVYISDRAYTKDQILAMESIMLNTLNFYITVPSTLRFGERFCKVGKSNTRQTHLVNYLMELTCQEYKFIKYLPSLIAASAVYLANTMTHATPWSETLESHTTYDEPALKACLQDLYDLATKQPTKYRAVRKKYANKKFDEVAHIPTVKPALLN